LISRLSCHPYNLGRTASHEVGHWMNLHVTLETLRGSDLVSDTRTNNAVCQHILIIAFVLVPVEMTMNYMDYTDDRGMYVFTDGQKASRCTICFVRAAFRHLILN
jgi:hypothetical protein